MSWLAGVVVTALLAAIGRGAASFFSGSCPFTATSFVCLNWETVATVAGAILGAVGYPVAKAGMTKSAASRAVVEQKAPEPVEPVEGANQGNENGYTQSP